MIPAGVLKTEEEFPKHMKIRIFLGRRTAHGKPWSHATTWVPQEHRSPSVAGGRGYVA